MRSVFARTTTGSSVCAGSCIAASAAPTCSTHGYVGAHEGVLGDVILVNGAPWPFFEAAARAAVAIALSPNSSASDDRLPDGLSRSLGSDVLVNLRPPRLVLVREPDLLRVERADQPLAFGARLVELGEEDRHVAADDD